MVALTGLVVTSYVHHLYRLMLMTKYHDKIKLLYDTRVTNYIVIGLSGSSPEMDWHFWLNP